MEKLIEPVAAGDPMSERTWVRVSLRQLSRELGEAGHPLATGETMLGYLQGTKTETGLTVRTALHDGIYQTGESVSDADIAALNLTRDDLCPAWNYSLRPRATPTPDSVADTAGWELIL